MAVINHLLSKKITETVIQGSSVCIDEVDKERPYRNTASAEITPSDDQGLSLGEQKALEVIYRCNNTAHSHGYLTSSLILHIAYQEVLNACSF